MRKRDAKKVESLAPEKEPFLPSQDSNLNQEVQKEELSEDEIKEVIEKTENDKKQLDEAEQTIAKHKSKKSKIVNLIFFLVNIGVVVGILTYQLLNQEVMDISTLLTSNLNWGFLVLAFVAFALNIFFDSLRTNRLVKKASGRSRPFLSYKVVALGRFYDAITPMSTGGEPFQIIYLKTHGLSASASISAPMGRYVLSQLTGVLMSTIAMIVAASTDVISGVNLISIAFYVGYSLNLFITLLTIFLSVSKAVGKKIVVGILKFLHKIKIVKNYEKQYNKVLKTVNDYQTTMQEFAKNKGSFVLLFLESIAQYLVQYTIPFFIACAFLGFRTDVLLELAIGNIMIDVAAGFIPLPGGTGMSELSFTALFASLFTEGTLFWAMLIWRFMSYYIYLLQGLALTIYDYFVGNKKYLWQKRKWELEAESAEFKEMKLRNFQRKGRKNWFK